MSDYNSQGIKKLFAHFALIQDNSEDNTNNKKVRKKYSAFFFYYSQNALIGRTARSTFVQLLNRDFGLFAQVGFFTEK